MSRIAESWLPFPNKQVKKHSAYSLPIYSWSSPVDIYDNQGNIYIFFTDVSGSVDLIDGPSGELLIKEKLNYTFDSSP
jgi:hypothetical protein